MIGGSRLGACGYAGQLGDAFNAGFAVALVHGFDMEKAVRFAQATSALNATGLGSQAGVKDFQHTLAFMNETLTKG